MGGEGRRPTGWARRVGARVGHHGERAHGDVGVGAGIAEIGAQRLAVVEPAGKGRGIGDGHCRLLRKRGIQVWVPSKGGSSDFSASAACCAANALSVGFCRFSPGVILLSSMSTIWPGVEITPLGAT